ncbi:hypothetical protein SSBR45G_02930 [Bradyrhizobium sp. SSBR45G]|uniref:DUF1800 domain-containing protein n=1 Tax=unclassified Bradyrhizobium TaxID=2631580 RepID=UPI0023428EB7|nr:MULTISPECIES: DUF1800 domain-containing protein [unclassified Bradyrhizobium]GLH75385.1 hypothetical protein SSBR45G_02930 [Bradyrhizobium sp. SSBR45G]GLH82828.1 hypothetical protein SSBR45R_02880 [Bradyrhizobium sp. SSBR45R]
MVSSGKADAVIALNRFGMGPRPGSIVAIASDPRGALLADLDRHTVSLAAAAALPDAAKAFRIVNEANARRQAKTVAARKAREEAQKQQAAAAAMAPMAASSGSAEADADAKAAAEAIPDPGRQFYLDEARVRTEAALTAEIGFAERLVWFWSNHFCISADKIQSMSGAYEREAIRPYALGRFTDLLLAVESHPAMLFYLDNTVSMGAGSIAGLNRSLGLNENLAREILELHTLGVRSGYGQYDVIAFANILTGWTLRAPAADPERGGEFIFNPRLHEPGAQTVMGKSYADEGVEQGRAVLRDLAAHPATASHVADKLARHFIADQPPQELVDELARVFRDTAGDLKETAKAMVTSAAAWTLPPSKLRRPSEWGVAMVRAAGITDVDGLRFTQGQRLLGEPLWRPSSPKGYADDEPSWIDGLGGRIDVANVFAERISGQVDPQFIIETVLQSRVSAEVMQAVAQAESRQQALVLLFMSSDFQRR